MIIDFVLIDVVDIVRILSVVSETRGPMRIVETKD